MHLTKYSRQGSHQEEIDRFIYLPYMIKRKKIADLSMSFFTHLWTLGRDSALRVLRNLRKWTTQINNERLQVLNLRKGYKQHLHHLKLTISHFTLNVMKIYRHPHLTSPCEWKEPSDGTKHFGNAISSPTHEVLEQILWCQVQATAFRPDLEKDLHRSRQQW
jgi:hypothetical protein